MREGVNLNAAIWPALREYIAAEVQLALQRHRLYHTSDMREPILPIDIAAEIQRLEEQVSRMETAIRESLTTTPDP